MDSIEDMKLGGRLNPDEPHKFVNGTRDRDGGTACNVCGGSKALPVHTNGADALPTHVRTTGPRAKHGPYGQ